MLKQVRVFLTLDPSVSTPPKEWPYSTLHKSPPLEHVLESHWSIHLQAYSRLVGLLPFKHNTEEYKEVKRWFVIAKNRHALKEPLRNYTASIHYQVIVTVFITQRLLLFVFVPTWKERKGTYIYFKLIGASSPSRPCGRWAGLITHKRQRRPAGPVVC